MGEYVSFNNVKDGGGGVLGSNRPYSEMREVESGDVEPCGPAVLTAPIYKSLINQVMKG